MSDKPVTKPQDMHATGTTETKAAAGAPQAESGDVTTQDMHATGEPVTTQDMHATSEPFKPKK
ncbi:hypothetical protein STXM2123_3270 [Streptomyces sp. F-3]|jgi:hypothetical protein|uniref:Sigma-like protein n=1 Tax=Streptomyces thermogriseus TaxID=75292 RepID=A0ABN1T3T7_9ACTN|nr:MULTISPECIES: hypothetical protein [Streptomyces]MDN5385497.1 hypothetical protein [Streptomyces sp. LB8]GAT82569.1 hypothetical protein STXM2123_3270 [Streptomyces sp. F-3]